MGCGALGVATALVFVPVGQAVAVKVTWAIASFLLLSLTYSFVNTAYGMLTNLMTASTTQRIQLTTARLIGANVGSVAIGWITLPMVALLGMGSARQGFRCS
jgi:Na+/melibiose symporter-like transporter